MMRKGRGFSDAESYFDISVNRGGFTFKFGIGLHIDDFNTLEFIKQNLQIGKIYIKSGKVASYLVATQEDVKL